MANGQIVPMDQVLPNKLTLIPLLHKPVFPGIFLPIMLVNQQDIDAAEKVLNEGGIIGLVLTRSEDVRNPTGSDLYRVGTVGKIVKKINLPDGGINIFISTLKRFKIKKILSRENPIVAAVEYLETVVDDTDVVKALARSLIGEMKQILENNPLYTEEMRLSMVNIDHPGKIADFIASILNTSREEQQDILESLDVKERMEKVLLFIKKEQELLRLQKKIQQQINEKIEKSQREY